MLGFESLGELHVDQAAGMMELEYSEKSDGKRTGSLLYRYISSVIIEMFTPASCRNQWRVESRQGSEVGVEIPKTHCHKGDLSPASIFARFKYLFIYLFMFYD